jgi:hypothetical protein
MMAMFANAADNVVLPPSALNDFSSDMFDYANYACFTEPRSFKEATTGADHEEWCKAMDDELKGFADRGGYRFVDLTEDMHLIDSKWVYKIKEDKDGNIRRFRSRLTARGFKQWEGIDYGEVYSPVARYSTMRIILALCAHFGLFKRHLDCPKAFIQADLDVPIYMKPPKGMKVPRGKVLLLLKSIYGLKQSSLLFHKLLRGFLSSIGFTQCLHDTCVFFQISGKDFALISLYVDDMLLATTTVELGDSIVAKLFEKFQVVDEGNFTWFLGMHIITSPDRHTISIDMSKYTQKIVDTFEITHLSSVPTPMHPSLKLSATDCPNTQSDRDEMAQFPFRSAVAMIMWLMLVSRLDVSFAIVNIARFCQNPGKSHWNALIMLIRYLKGTIDMLLTYKRDPHASIPILFGMCDADWATNDIDTRRSVIGFIIWLCGGPIMWLTKFSKIAQSSTEAEYYADGAAANASMGSRHLLGEIIPINWTGVDPTTILGDNTSMIAIANNPCMHDRLKHIAIKHHFIRELITKSLIRNQYVPSALNVADMMVKAQQKIRLRMCRKFAFGPDAAFTEVLTPAEKQAKDKKRKASLALENK